MEEFKLTIKKYNLLFLGFILLFMVITGIKVDAVSTWESDYFAYGSGLSEAQLLETQSLVGMPEDRDFTNIVVTGNDYQQFTGRAMSDSNMYSSVVVQQTEKNSGVQVFINTPENITQIKDHQYMNAALTSGITDCNIIVGSPVVVTGESALIGVYKAFEDAGYALNEDATKVATDELTMVNEINQENTSNLDFDSEDFSLALTEIKKQISEITDKGSITVEEINVIVIDVLNRYNIEISDANKERLIGWLNDFKALDIDWDVIRNELNGLGDLISKKAGEIYQWGQESGFFTKLWQSIRAFLKSLFN